MKLRRNTYERLLRPLERRLVEMARWASATGTRIVVLLEGRDTAGKGGAAKTVSARLDPKQCRTVALDVPTERERTQWYFQRYVPHLPAAGEIVLFDRSWYNRAGVERVMGFCTEQQVEHFFDQVRVFEQLLVDDGVLLYKYWLHCDQAQQEERLNDRLADPLKRWKLSQIDIAARERYDDYTKAREAMLAATHTGYAPWTIVDFNDQRLGRLTLIDDLLAAVPYEPVDQLLVTLPPLAGEPSADRFECLEPVPAYRAPE